MSGASRRGDGGGLPCRFYPGFDGGVVFGQRDDRRAGVRPDKLSPDRTELAQERMSAFAEILGYALLGVAGGVVGTILMLLVAARIAKWQRR